jgi:hypothetical protein
MCHGCSGLKSQNEAVLQNSTNLALLITVAKQVTAF